MEVVAAVVVVANVVVVVDVVDAIVVDVVGGDCVVLNVVSGTKSKISLLNMGFLMLVTLLVVTVAVALVMLPTVTDLVGFNVVAIIIGFC